MHFLTRVGITVAAALAAAACGGSVNQGGSGGSGAGGSGAGGSGGYGAGGYGAGGAGGYGAGGAGGYGAGGSGGFAGVAGGGVAGSGGGIACGETHDIVAVTIDSQFAPGPVCPDSGGSPNVVWQHTGRVVKSANNTFVMDTCPPNADCIQMFTTVTVKAEGLDLNIPVGTLVDVREELNKVWMVCSTQLSIRNVANWGGEQNPVWSNDNGWWLLATDRTATPPKESPLSVSVADIGCYLNTPGCGGAQAPGDYALLFDVGPGQPGVMVGMGQVEWIYNGIQDFMVRNQRSYQSGACDDYWNWSWWAMYAPLEAN